MGKTYRGVPITIGVCRKCGKSFDDYQQNHRKYICRDCWNEGTKLACRRACDNLNGYFKQLLTTIRNYKYRKDLPNELDVPYLMELYELQNGRCAISNIEMTWGQEDPKDGKKIYRRPHNISIDRLDNTRGYTKDNVILICYSVNIFKNTHDVSNVYKITEAIIRNKNRLNEVMHLIQNKIEN